MSVLVVGAGPYGATVARTLRDRGVKDIVVVDRRDHIAGNCYDTPQDDGKSYLHHYGPHIFHTNNEFVWNFVNRFARFNNYQHFAKSVGSDGNIYSLPFCWQTFWEIYGPGFSKKIQKNKNQISAANLEEFAVSQIGRRVYELLIKEYTEKQWGMPCRDLPASIIRRIPIRQGWNTNYFEDAYQGMPLDGYTNMFGNMLEGIDVYTGVEYTPGGSEFAAFDFVFYSGPLDKFFDYRYGPLDYRSLTFETAKADDQGCAVFNYATKEKEFTRATQWSYFYGTNGGLTTYEYPRSQGDPYYPIRTKENTKRAAKYLKLVPEDAKFGGRLATFQYYDMHQVIAQGMKDANKFVDK